MPRRGSTPPTSRSTKTGSRLYVAAESADCVQPDSNQSPDEATRYLLLPEEIAFYRENFPGIDLDSVTGKLRRRTNPT